MPCTLPYIAPFYDRRPASHAGQGPPPHTTHRLHKSRVEWYNDSERTISNRHLASPGNARGKGKGAYDETEQLPEMLERGEMALSDPEEERLVAELELLGIRYLSRQTAERAASVRPPAVLLADLIRQPSARVRTAVIAVLLSHPDLAEALPAALQRLSPPERQTLLFFYTAAVLLQQQYASQLQPYVAWQPLPDRFAVDLGLPPSAPIRERLAALGRRQRQQTGRAVNWPGTYEQVVRHLLHAWELECHDIPDPSSAICRCPMGINTRIRAD